MQDDELISRYRTGETELLTLLVEKYLPVIYNFVYRFTKDEAEREDITQEVFIKVWSKLESYKLGYSFKSWVFGIAHNTAIDALRKKRPQTFSSLAIESNEDNIDLLDVESVTPFEEYLVKESSLRLEQALEKLPALYRSIVLLHLEEDLTFKDIAFSIGKPLNTVKSQYRRGIVMLKELLQNE